MGCMLMQGRAVSKAVVLSACALQSVNVRGLLLGALHKQPSVARGRHLCALDALRCG